MRTALQIINEVEEHLEWPKSETITGEELSSKTRKLRNLLNYTLRNLQRIENWNQLRERSAIRTMAPYTTGTVTTTDGSFQLQGSGTTWTTDMEGAAIKIEDNDYIYTVKTVKSTTEIELYEPITSSGALTGKTYTLAQNEYQLPDDFDRFIEPMRSFDGPSQVVAVTPEEMSARLRQDKNIETGDPRMYTLVGDTESDKAWVVFYPYPDDKVMLPYNYMRLHPEVEKDSQLIFYEMRHVDLIIDVMIDVAMRDFEDDDRMMRTLQDRIANTNKVKGQVSITEQPLVFGKDDRHHHAQAFKWRSRGRRYDYGTTFDRVGFRTFG